MKNAGFWWRLLAYIIDTILLMVAAFLTGIVLGFIIGIAMAIFGGAEHKSAVSAILGYMIGIVLSWLYYTWFESSPRMATPGKYWLGMMVTDEQGQRINFRQANIRYWSKILSAIILCIGYLMIAFTEKKQGLHDIIAKTLVTKKG